MVTLVNKIKKNVLYSSLLCVFCSIFFLSCRHKKVEVDSFKGGFISTYGLYTTETREYTINVSENPKGILKYIVQKQDKTVLIDSDKSKVRVGIYQKWKIYWDNNTEYLWIDSSDRGMIVWIKKADGSYEEDSLRLNVEPYFKDKIPEALWTSHNIPRTLQRGIENREQQPIKNETPKEQ